MSEHLFLTLFTYFPAYAFLGWCLEVVYTSVNTGKFVNRGFLNGAVCPIYGFGAVLLILVLTPFANNFSILFLASVILASLLELVGGYALEKTFHMRWWDYSEEPFNLGGFICLKFSLLWGLAGVCLIKIVQPIIAGLVSHLPVIPVTLSIACFYLVFILDILVTVITIVHLNRDLKQVDELSRLIRQTSDVLAENLGTFAVDASEKLDAHRDELAESLAKEIDTLLTHEKRSRTRLLRAFPNAKRQSEGKALERLRERYDALKKK